MDRLDVYIERVVSWAKQQYPGASVLLMGSAVEGKLWPESDIDIAIICDDLPPDNPGCSAWITGEGVATIPVSVTLMTISALERLASFQASPAMLQLTAPLGAFSGARLAWQPVSALDSSVCSAVETIRKRYADSYPSFARYEATLCLSALRNVRKALHFGLPLDAIFMSLQALNHARRATAYSAGRNPGRLVLAETAETAETVEPVETVETTFQDSAGSGATSTADTNDCTATAREALSLIEPVIRSISQQFRHALAGLPAMSLLQMCSHFPEMSNGSAVWDDLILALVENMTLRVVATPQGYGVSTLAYELKRN